MSRFANRESGEVLILAKSRLQVLLEKNDDGESLWTVIAELKGRDLEGLDYEPLFSYMHPEKKCWYVTSGSFVSTEDGTGIVHIAPAFGADDYEIAKKYDLPMLQPVGTERLLYG